MDDDWAFAAAAVAAVVAPAGRDGMTCGVVGVVVVVVVVVAADEDVGCDEVDDIINISRARMFDKCL